MSIVLALTGLSVFGVDDYSNEIDPLLDVKPVEQQKADETSVTAVYGVNTEDYRPLKEVARQHLRPNVRKSRSHPGFDLPDVFYFVVGPLFLLAFLSVLVIFLNGFEEARKEELRLAAREGTLADHISLNSAVCVSEGLPQAVSSLDTFTSHAQNSQNQEPCVGRRYPGRLQ